MSIIGSYVFLEIFLLNILNLLSPVVPNLHCHIKWWLTFGFLILSERLRWYVSFNTEKAFVYMHTLIQCRTLFFFITSHSELRKYQLDEKYIMHKYTQGFIWTLIFLSRYKTLLHNSLYRKSFTGMEKVINMCHNDHHDLSQLLKTSYASMLWNCDIQIITLGVVLCVMPHVYKRSDGTYTLHNVSTYQTTRNCITWHNDIHNHQCESPASHISTWNITGLFPDHCCFKTLVIPE